MQRSEQRPEVVVVGRSCRLPGAASVDELWANLVEGRCSISEIPDDRWSKAKHGHPRAKEPGKSYTWAAGVLPDIWGFDPGVFGISPREAEQMDPHQRLMLELTWEALEDAGIRRSNVAGTDVGVFIGASSPEFTAMRAADMAGGDAYTATGGALSIVSNRISHAFDFKGPSFTVDTACSSSLVALHQAMQAIQSGRIDTAIVGGINLLLSPFGFVTFSQASMLSPTGLCQTFDAGADGYVRAEGAVVLVLKTAERAARDEARVYARIAASGVNSDGRTNGIALPSRFSQAKLLREVYAEAGLKSSQIAFVEAHGTGTRVGDPIEAFTIGDVLGRDRDTPLMIGSIKSNIGHLEPASGLAGMLKAMLALEHDLLPASVNYAEPNPDIPFGELNLEVCAKPTPVPRRNGPRYVGINSFGFGGTNAHVVIGDPVAAPARTKRYTSQSDRLALSGASRPAVLDLARRYAERLSNASSETIQEFAAAAAHRREMLSERAVVEWRSPRDLVRKLEQIADKTDEVAGVTWGTVTEPDAPVAFVFSGNGGQWPGMGRAVYGQNRVFREAFDEVDQLFDSQFGWSITEALFANDLDQRLQYTHVAQPLIFAIQIATARALAAEGLAPSYVIGHSVGEIAAAAVAGALTLADAVAVIHARSAHQELARDTGRMAVVVGSLLQVEELAAEIGEIEVAAFNSPRTFTVAGPTDRIKALGAKARKRRIVFRQLDLDYPFHCALIDPVREPLRRDLEALRSSATRIDMISTVTGELADGTQMGEAYWWRNVREPVRFSAAIETAAHAGARVFVEIGPRSVLLSAVNETLEPTSLPFAALGVLERREDADETDPIRPAVVNAFVRGAAIELDKLFGPEPSRPVAIPSYGWQRREFRPVMTLEAVGSTLDTRWHRLIGGRNSHDGVEWTGQLDTAAQPELADHDVGGQAILPGAAFIEIALAVARDWFETGTAALLDLDIAQPLQLEHDRAREVKARLSPSTNTLEILSRPRLSRGAWSLHATAKLTAGAPDPIRATLPSGTSSESRQTFDADAVYRAAVSVGLNYGPEFRLVRAVTRIGEDRLLVDLVPSAPHGDYRIDPARLDACFHGLFVLFAGLGAAQRGTAYLPVRFGHVRLTRDGALPATALIDLRKVGERSIVADFTLFDAHGLAIASLSECRFQAARVRRPNLLADRALSIGAVAADLGLMGGSGTPAGSSGILARAEALGLLVGADAEETSEHVLLEGWATAASYEIARGIDPSGIVSPGFIAALPAPSGSWLASLLHALEAGELAEVTEGGWRITPDADLPSSNAILRALADDHPGRSAEMLLASSMAELARDGALLAEDGDHGPSGATVDGFELAGASVRAAGDLVVRLLDETGVFGAAGRGLRVLQIGYGPLSAALRRAGQEHGLRLTILEPDPRRLERAKLTLGTSHDVAFLEKAADLADGSYDLVVAAERLHRLGRTMSLADLRRALARGGSLVAVEPVPSQFRDLTLGLAPDWFDGGAAIEFPVSPLRGEEPWRRELEGSGFANVVATSVRTGGSTSILLLGEAVARTSAPAGVERVIHVEGRASDLALQFETALVADGHRVDRTDEAERLGRPGEGADTLVFLGQARAGLDDVAALRDLCMELKACVEALAGEKTDVWIVAEAADGRGALADAVMVGLLSFSRTLANEVPGVTIRRVSLGSGLDVATAVMGLASLLRAEQSETDILIDRDGCRVLRVEPLHDRHIDTSALAPAARLERGLAGGLAGITWVGIEAPPPAGHGEVEIAVAASGLNFRDVMWAMSLLPDDILEDGFAGPTLGLECAGRITRVGPGVTRFKAGDAVIAFAPSAFATAVTVPQNVVAPVPAGVDMDAAASIPVAFLTAYYGLVTLAGLKAGEWVLIHGAAGGVGLAAIQIAQERGAKIVATAGSREKRHLLHALGIEHVLNSRSSVFADEIREICPAGVDVVLNSLAGEAMERGLSTLKPFGRFIELGKRDYVGNTKIGLRPFRRNLSYFGVDVDQLLSDRDRASEIFGEVIAGFEAGHYRPLPYRVYQDGEVVDAFRLMQQSGHIGKIVLRPPTKPVPMSGRDEFTFDPARTHLVTGGFGGFGLETAIWLADRGVRHLVLTGRKGAESEDAKSVVTTLTARGVDVLAAACDVADERALSRLLDEVRRTMPPLGGIMHAAMVLEDGMLGNLNEDQLTRVLTPKVQGAALLDRLTADDALDYFVLFSSITTVVGNPGQAAYVAANGYLEGLARARREAGRPALALAWGAISDVGVLARQKGLAEALAKRVGVKAMPAREALDLMVQALSRHPGPVDEAVLAIGSLDWSAARRLPALSSPTFAALVRDGVVVDGGDRASIDLRALVATTDSESVRKMVIDVIVEEIATVLRIPRQDVGSTKKLAEMGLDSLMAIELATALQDRLELGSPPTGSVGSLTVPGLAENLISFVHSGTPDEDSRVTQALNDRHAGVALDDAAMASVMEAVATYEQTAKGVSQ